MNINELEEIGKLTIDDQLIYFGARFGGKTETFTVKLQKHPYFQGGWQLQSDWKEVTKTLGDVKGSVSTEDRQLLKIVHNLSDEDVDKMISEYKKQYKIYLKNSKIYGKEKWRN